jgi:hypothetical protein
MASRQNKKTMMANIASKDLHAQKNESNKTMARRTTAPTAMEEKTSILSIAFGNCLNFGTGFAVTLTLLNQQRGTVT